MFGVQVVVNESHTQFIEHVIFIMKNVLENSNNKNDQPAEHLGVTSIEGMMLAIVRSVPMSLTFLIATKVIF